MNANVWRNFTSPSLGFSLTGLLVVASVWWWVLPPQVHESSEVRVVVVEVVAHTLKCLLNSANLSHEGVKICTVNKITLPLLWLWWWCLVVLVTPSLVLLLGCKHDCSVPHAPSSCGSRGSNPAS